jgi:heterodisulfide reductase subunit C
MKNQLNPHSEEVIEFSRSDFDFISEVKQRSGTDISACYHCWCCAGRCPFYEAMDYSPNGVIRLVQIGLKQTALACSTIWICVGCHTCSTACPMAIDMSAMMDALRQMALAEGVSVPEQEILDFHKEVLNSVEQYGRTHKLEIMLRYKIRRRDWFSDMDVGLKMLAKRKLDLRPSKVDHIEDIRNLFN